jgi:hypothetical protein
MTSPPARTPEEIRASVEATREELRHSLVDLRGKILELHGKINQLSDWRAPLRRNRQAILIGAAATGFLVGGGIVAAVSLMRRR